jgi:hypothetical protein
MQNCPRGTIKRERMKRQVVPDDGHHPGRVQGREV